MKRNSVSNAFAVATAIVRCRDGHRSLGPTFGRPLYGLHNSAEEVARCLLVVMRRGSLCAAEEITGHKYETLGGWLRRAGEHAEAISPALVTDLHLWEVEVDAFCSFVKKSVQTLCTPHNKRIGYGVDRVAACILNSLPQQCDRLHSQRIRGRAWARAGAV